ncbi:MAG: glutamate-5-semialdehyde dehydrogenase [Firmicutes bacterium]|nr:glutamate-5-semialdehyde dehydrogenase [Bacillota bacterium]
MNDAYERARQAIEAAHGAKDALGAASASTRDAALLALAEALEEGADALLEANARDVEAARRGGLAPALLGRLGLDGRRLAGMAARARAVAALPDPLALGGGARILPSGIRLEARRVPLGLIGVVYESRPDVTTEVAGIALKAGNAAVLRGGREAEATQGVLADILAGALGRVGLPSDAVRVVTDDAERGGFKAMMESDRFDLVVPRGGAGLIERVRREAHAPVIETGVGNCHVYVDGAADLDMAEAIVVDAKVDNPAVCNAAETILVDAALAEAALPRLGRALAAQGVRLRACPRSLALLRSAGVPAEAADEADWGTEYLDLVAAVRVVEGVEGAVEHIRRYGTRHSEAIVTDSLTAAERFAAGVDAAAVYVNASTRFTDGYEWGLGAEVGISTQKLHVRGPVGLEALTTLKYVAVGSGQVRGTVARRMARVDNQPV